VPPPALAKTSLPSLPEKIAPCRETYPHAIAVSRGAEDEPKAARDGVLARLRAAGAYTGWPHQGDDSALEGIAFGLLHDRLEAYLCAWVASLDESELVEYGESPDDVIWVPRIPFIDPRNGETL